MSYRVPSFDETHGFLIAFWRAIFPKSDVGSRFRYHWKRLRAYAGGITDLHAHIASAQQDVMPDTARGPYATRWGASLGVDRKSATPARGTACLRVFGTAGATGTIGDQLLHVPTGFTYQLTKTIVLPVAGYADFDIAAISTGAATRLNAGETLNFVAPAGGIQVAAKLVKNIDQDGYDAELDPAYVVRYNAELGAPRMGGSQDDFVKWALQVVGVAEAFAYPNRAGTGTIDVVAFHAGQGSARSLTPTERAAVLSRITGADGLAKTLGAAPAQIAGVGGALRVLTTIASPQNVEITVTANGDQAYAFDWDDSTPPVVLAYTPATRSLQFAAQIPASMIAGRRLSLRGVATVQDGSPLTIETVSAADTITIRETPAVNPAATDIAYAGGSLVKPIRDAIIAHMNGEIVYADAGVPTPASVALSTVNAKILANGIGPANPTGVYGSWSGTLIRAVLSKIASYPTGARNVAIVTPGADVEATDDAFPNDGQIHFITPGNVLVRRG